MRQDRSCGLHRCAATKFRSQGDALGNERPSPRALASGRFLKFSSRLPAYRGAIDGDPNRTGLLAHAGEKPAPILTRSTALT